MKDFTYTDVVLASCERDLSVSRIAREHPGLKWLDLDISLLEELMDIADDNRMTDEELARHFRPTDL